MHKATAEITEIFSSIQGEGVFVGAKQIFVRFRDCNLSCSFCDEPRESPGSIYTPEALMGRIRSFSGGKGSHHSVSLTGGEPLCYTDFLVSFLPLLQKAGIKSYLETNGTLPEELKRVIRFIDIVAMDIKLPSSTGVRAFWDEHLKFLKIARRKMVFVKVVVSPDTTARDIGKAVSIISALDRAIPFILQPVTPLKRSGKAMDNKALIELMEGASGNGLKHVRAIPQVHKMMGIK